MNLKRLLLCSVLLLLCGIAYAQNLTIDGHTIWDTEIQEYHGLATAPSVSPTGYARLYYDQGDDKLYISKSGGAYAEIGGSSSFSGDLDDIDDGSTYGKATLVQLTQWAAVYAAYSSDYSSWMGFSLWDKSYDDLTDKPTIPTALSGLSDDATHRVVTDTEKSTWNGKQDALSEGTDYLNSTHLGETYLGLHAKADTSGNADTVTNGVYTTDAGSVFLAPNGSGASLSNVLHNTTTSMSGNQTFSDADGASLTWTWNLIANDPSMTFGASYIQANNPFYCGYGSNAAGEVRILEDSDDGSNYTSLKGQAFTNDYTLILPNETGTAGQVLEIASVNSNTMTLEWDDDDTGTGSGSVTYYVDATGGSDLDTGLVGHAWQTFDAVEAASFNAGDVILLKRGETWSDTLSIDEVGTPDNPVTIGAYGTGAKPIIASADTRASGIVVTGDYVTIKDIDLKEATFANIELDGAQNITIENCDIHDASEGVRVGGTSNYATFKNCKIYDNNVTNKTGIWVNESGYLTVDGCEFYGQNDSISLWEAGGYDHFDIENNYFHDEANIACHLIDEVPDTLEYVTVANNRFVNSGTSGDEALLIWYSNTAEVYGNYFYGNNGWGMDLYACDNVMVYNNIIASTVGTSAGAAIEINSCDDSFVTGNTIYNSNYGILYNDEESITPTMSHGSNTYHNCGISVSDETGGATIIALGGDTYIDNPVIPSADTTGNGTIIKATSGDNYGGGIAVYIGSDGKYYEAQSDSLSTLPCIGLALEGAAADETDKKILTEGFYRDDSWDWTPGEILYVDPDSSGYITATKPVGDYVQKIGVAFTADVIYVKVSPEVEHSTGTEQDVANLRVIRQAADVYNVDVDADGINIGGFYAENVDVTIDCNATAGANSRDTGASLTASTWWTIWLLAKTDGTVCGVISTQSSFASVTKPSGYVYGRQIGWVRSTSDSEILNFSYKGNGFWSWNKFYNLLNNGTQTSMTDVSCTAYMPPTSTVFTGFCSVDDNDNSGAYMYMRSNGTTNAYGESGLQILVSATSTTRNFVISNGLFFTGTDQIFEYMVESGDTGGSININGYYDNITPQ